MQTLILAAVLAAIAPNDWENPAVNSINRLPARTYAMPLADEESALTDALEPETPYRKSLNGSWRISWAGDPARRVRDFWKPDYDDSAWSEVDVPSCLELRGFGAPGYVNVRYPHAPDWPKILDRYSLKADYNPVASYRTRFTLPVTWSGRDVILRFDGVGSAYYVWVNGHRVGYAEDSKLPSEFDVTGFLVPGENLLAVEVYRWCDGSYLEDQDMFRYSGIFRDVTLWAMPKDGIWDFRVETEIAADFKSATLAVSGCDLADAKLYDADRRLVGAFTCGLAPLAVPDVRLWSAEDPYLYTLVLRKGDDIRMKRVGFKRQEIVGSVFTVNGRPVKFKGVNRHETSPENGRTVTLDDMVRDITLMKRFNVNTVRTSHYPNHHLWYDLCDRYGVYLVAEANVEGHEPGYGDKGLGRFPAWDGTIVERNERHVVFYRNHPAVTMWSMGNETGHGDCFRHAIMVVRSIDPTRPVHWERGNPDADVDSRMYPSVEWLEDRGRFGDATSSVAPAGEDGGEFFKARRDHTRGKCAFLCEYAHAMGNAIGNFEEYWQVFYRHPSLCGGCIWDWVDQAVWKYTDRVDPKTGERERYLAYGGDFDDAPNDGPFCCNGVVDPQRNVTAKLVEVGHVHRNLVVTRSERAPGDNPHAVVFELWNRFSFTRADRFVCSWELVEDGVALRRGAFQTAALEPLSRCRFTVPGLAEALAGVCGTGELFVNFSFATREDAIWAKAGHVVARDQVALPSGDFFARAAAAPHASGANVTVAESARAITVKAGATEAVFCRRSGTLASLTMGGKTILRDPAPGVVTGPRFTCMRAFTDNDIWLRGRENPPRDGAKASTFYTSGLTQLSYHPQPIAVSGNVVRVTTDVTGRKSAGFVHVATWTFADDGSVRVDNAVTPYGAQPPALPRLGLSLTLDGSLERLTYYGRGPRENYVDRKSGSFLGRWESTVTDQYEPYVRPQDNGYKCDVRWASFADAQGRGVMITASAPMFLQALHYGVEDLEFARHRNHQQRLRVPLEPRREICVNLDWAQLGLGGNSCGPTPMAKYVLKAQPTAWSFTMRPLGK